MCALLLPRIFPSPFDRRTPSAPQTVFYADIAGGSDTVGDGTTGNPYQTLTKCLVEAGDGATIRLNTGSACIDAGVYIAGVNDGYLGSAPDMGYAEKA